MKALAKSLTAAAAASLPAVALAHPGHGVLTGALHGMEPVHVLPVLAIVAVGVWLVRRSIKARSR